MIGAWKAIAGGATHLPQEAQNQAVARPVTDAPRSTGDVIMVAPMVDGVIARRGREAPDRRRLTRAHSLKIRRERSCANQVASLQSR